MTNSKEYRDLAIAIAVASAVAGAVGAVGGIMGGIYARSSHIEAQQRQDFEDYSAELDDRDEEIYKLLCKAKNRKEEENILKKLPHGKAYRLLERMCIQIFQKYSRTNEKFAMRFLVYYTSLKVIKDGSNMRKSLKLYYEDTITGHAAYAILMGTQKDLKRLERKAENISQAEAAAIIRRGKLCQEILDGSPSGGIIIYCQEVYSDDIARDMR